MKQPDPLSIAGLVHDLNNVLQTLVGVALQTEDESASAAILRSVDRARGILMELQSGPASLLPLEAIVGNAAAFVRDHSGSDVQVATAIEPGIQLSRAWERVLINLFLNSVRAMPGGEIRVAARQQEGCVEIVVSDEGPGIAVALLERLFEPHVSGNGSSGLGLSIVHSIVQADGGTIRAANLQPGAEFTISLPRAAKAKRAAR